MQRKIFDVFASVIGVVMVVVLAVAGGLLMWGASFANSNVHDQLAQQQVYFPPQAAFAHAKAGTEITPNMIPVVSQYAGQQVLTGQQAEVYANHFIAQHLYDMPYHGVYANIEHAAARAATPGSAQAQKLAALEQTSFQGTTLAGCCSRATPSRCSAKSPSGQVSPPLSWPASWRCWSPSASGTLGGPQRKRNSPCTAETY